MRGLLHFKPPFKKEANAIEHKARVMRHKERHVFIKDINLDTGPASFTEQRGFSVEEAVLPSSDQGGQLAPGTKVRSPKLHVLLLMLLLLVSTRR